MLIPVEATALLHAGLVPAEPPRGWGHDWVQARFVAQLIQRRKVYAASLRRTLVDLLGLRHRAVYPEATFRVVEGEDPQCLYIDAFTDADDSFGVFNLVNDWLVDLSITEGIHLHVIPLPRPHVALAEEA